MLLWDRWFDVRSDGEAVAALVGGVAVGGDGDAAAGDNRMLWIKECPIRRCLTLHIIHQCLLGRTGFICDTYSCIQLVQALKMFAWWLKCALGAPAIQG